MFEVVVSVSLLCFALGMRQNGDTAFPLSLNMIPIHVLVTALPLTTLSAGCPVTSREGDPSFSTCMLT